MLGLVVIHFFLKLKLIGPQLRAILGMGSHCDFKGQKMIDGIKKSEFVKRGDIQVKLLMSVNRKHTREEAMESIKVAQQFPEYVVGVELGGDPKHHDWVHFEPVFQSARDAGLSARCLQFLHNGGLKPHESRCRPAQ